jgi:hypothetical protein
MGISIEQLCETYPRLYHMAEATSWPSISKHGLLSTSGLLDLYAINGKQRTLIESHHRPQSVVIKHPKYGSAVIRDQKPMRESALLKCLVGCTPKQWYEFLNRRVFFWLTEERVCTLLKARPYRGDVHIVIIVDTESLLRVHGRASLLSPINSGSTIYRPVSRGIASFQPPGSYPYAQRRKARGKPYAIAELAVEYSVPGIRDYVLRVERRRASKLLDILYSKKF